MSPKEKAQYLFDIYTNYVGEYDVSKHAKQCALIAIDEILSFIEDNRNGFSFKTYYIKVKKEIENL